jgi:hypothetical protein
MTKTADYGIFTHNLRPFTLKIVEIAGVIIDTVCSV